MPGDYTKDFSLEALELTTCTGEVYNLRWVFIELNVYEAIWDNQMTCDVVLNDANNMLMNLPIFGYEDLKISFRTPDKGLFTKVFRVHSITDRVLTKERTLGYIIHGVTPEAIRNLKTRVSKSYKSKLISDIVSDLHYSWLGGGAAEIETTKYQHHIIIPNMMPCHAINWLCTRANPAGYEGANYLYYQDKDQFRFVSLESRLERGPQIEYIYQVANVRKDGSVGHKPQELELNVVAVESYTFDHHSDILDNMRTGMYGNELLTHSHSKKIWRRYTFDYPGSFDTYKHLYQGNYLESSARQDVNKKDSKLKLHATGFDQDGFPFLPEKWIPPRISQLQQLMNVRLTITVPGDSDRTVGQVVFFHLPSPEPPQDNQQIHDKYYKGKYLVSGVRHKIDVDKYTTTLELIKDSTFTKYP